MELVFGINKLNDKLPGCVMTIGNFDGLHLGHRQIIDKVVSDSKKLNTKSVAYTFFPHPQTIFNKNFKLVSTLEQKINYFRETGIELLIVEPFNEEFALLDPQKFVQDVLINKLSCMKIIIGYDFSFGKKGAGNGNLLSKYSQFSTQIVQPIIVDNEVVHSTLLRTYLEEGNIERYLALTGRNPQYSGIVTSGRGIGNSKLGYSTANIYFPANIVRPQKGVYIVKGRIGATEKYGIANVGVKPTIGEYRINLEVHFFDFYQNIYGEKIQIELLKFLRQEKKYDNISELVKQVTIDVKNAKNYLNL